ncbi:hypothetical protein BC938DRAFT_480123 [Jimgerdemannia flammicorona]|uniref:Zn(2)-C6 fungal-type domain-containing protein n=1 Tax=Jimgerdemannia flammicorona TaxID=994334 RepID=A0A433QJC3_9FUNG|nr:hypothetical protein BC938DRAFT_480123 [Jimgerdemannia flammicorona]
MSAETKNLHKLMPCAFLLKYRTTIVLSNSSEDMSSPYRLRNRGNNNVEAGVPSSRTTSSSPPPSPSTAFTSRSKKPRMSPGRACARCHGLKKRCNIRPCPRCVKAKKDCQPNEKFRRPSLSPMNVNTPGEDGAASLTTETGLLYPPYYKSCPMTGETYFLSIPEPDPQICSEQPESLNGEVFNLDYVRRLSLSRVLDFLSEKITAVCEDRCEPQIWEKISSDISNRLLNAVSDVDFNNCQWLHKELEDQFSTVNLDTHLLKCVCRLAIVLSHLLKFGEKSVEESVASISRFLENIEKSFLINVCGACKHALDNQKNDRSIITHQNVNILQAYLIWRTLDWYSYVCGERRPCDERCHSIYTGEIFARIRDFIQRQFNDTGRSD